MPDCGTPRRWWGLRRRRRRVWRRVRRGTAGRHVRHDAAPPDAAAFRPPHVCGRLHVRDQREGEAAGGVRPRLCGHSCRWLSISFVRETSNICTTVAAEGKRGRTGQDSGQLSSSDWMRRHHTRPARCVPVLDRVAPVPPARCTLDPANVPCTLRHVSRSFDPLKPLPCPVLCSGRSVGPLSLRCETKVCRASTRVSFRSSVLVLVRRTSPETATMTKGWLIKPDHRSCPHAARIKAITVTICCCMVAGCGAQVQQVRPREGGPHRAEPCHRRVARLRVRRHERGGRG